MDIAFSQVRELGSLVLFRRNAAGLTQEELADRSGLSVRTIRDIERGRTMKPSPASIRLLAQALENSGSRIDELVAAAAINRVRGMLTVARPHPRPSTFATSAVRPAQTPAAIGDFTGRETEIVAVRRRFATDHSVNTSAAIAAITGMAGVGKTALALRVAHQLATQFPDGQLYADLRGSDRPATARDVILRFLHDLAPVPREAPGADDESAGQYQSLLAGRRVLIVLDDVSDATHARPFIPGNPRCGVLITSRNRLADLEGTRPLPLGVLPAADARDMLAGIAGADRIHAEPAETDAILAACTGLPLAIRIAGARLASRPHWKLATLARRLGNSERLLDELRLGKLSVTASLRQSFDSLLLLGDAGSQAQQVFRALGQFESAVITPHSVASVMGSNVSEIERLLEILVDASLLEARTSGSYYIHSLIQMFSRHVLREPWR